MSTTQWIISVVVALIGGGAMGAVITAVVTNYRNRRQPVAYNLEIIEAFKENPEFPLLEANLSSGPVDEIGIKHILPIRHLSVARLTLINRGNQDIEAFRFGVTLKDTNQAVDIKVITPDRHHVVEILTPVSPDNPLKELDFVLKPFNRRNKYRIDIYFIYDDVPGAIKLSSPHSTIFVDFGEPNAVNYAIGGKRTYVRIPHDNS